MGLLPTPRNPGMTADEALYRGAALHQLAILRQQMKLGGLKTGNRILRLDGGVEIKCSICFNQETVNVYVPPVDDNAQPIVKDDVCTIYTNIKLDIKLPHATGDVYGFLPGITINTINLEKLPGTIFNILTNTGGYYYSNKHERLSNYFIDNEENRSLFGLNDYYFGGFEECNVPEDCPAVVVWFINGELHPTDRLAVKLYFFIQKADGTVCPYHADAERIAEVQEYHPERIPPDYYPVYLPQKPPDTSNGVAPILLYTSTAATGGGIVVRNVVYTETAAEFIARRNQQVYDDIKKSGSRTEGTGIPGRLSQYRFMQYLPDGGIQSFVYRQKYVDASPPSIAFFEVNGEFVPVSSARTIVEAYTVRQVRINIMWDVWVQVIKSYKKWQSSAPSVSASWRFADGTPDNYIESWLAEIPAIFEYWHTCFVEGTTITYNDDGIPGLRIDVPTLDGAEATSAYLPYGVRDSTYSTFAWMHDPDEWVQISPPDPRVDN